MPTDLFPTDPIAAVTHPDPYPYYRHLVAEHPLYHDDHLNCWVAASAEAVRAVLTSPLCRVRPLAEPVPTALVGSPTAEIFGRLVRMNEGERHQPFKQAIDTVFTSLDDVQIGQQAGQWAHHLANELAPHEQVSAFTFQLSAYVVGGLLGIPHGQLEQTARWISQYVAAVAPGAHPAIAEQGSTAADCLLEQFHSLLTDKPNGMLSALASEANRVGRDDTALIVANAIGFLSQAYEATAGLIGSTLLRLGSDRTLHDQVSAYPDLLNAVVQEVMRFDSPVQNTRRFVARSGTIAG